MGGEGGRLKSSYFRLFVLAKVNFSRTARRCTNSISSKCRVRFSPVRLPKKISHLLWDIFFGAGGENRTLIACLEGRHISHYTTPADSDHYTSNSMIFPIHHWVVSGIKQAFISLTSLVLYRGYITRSPRKRKQASVSLVSLVL